MLLIWPPDSLSSAFQHNFVQQYLEGKEEGVGEAEWRGVEAQPSEVSLGNEPDLSPASVNSGAPGPPSHVSGGPELSAGAFITE